MKKDPAFERACKEFLSEHLAKRTGPAAERLKGGLQHAELLFLQNVWWPSFSNFEDLHPEYEVKDFKDGYRYIDFAYIRPNYRLAIEIDGFGPHWKNIDQDRFSDNTRRQNHLAIDGWHVLRFTYRDIEQYGRICEQDLQQMIGRLAGNTKTNLMDLSIVEREIVRFALNSKTIDNVKVSQQLHMPPRTTSRRLKDLTEKGWIEPVSGTLRIRSYRIHPLKANIKL